MTKKEVIEGIESLSDQDLIDIQWDVEELIRKATDRINQSEYEKSKPKLAELATKFYELTKIDGVPFTGASKCDDAPYDFYVIDWIGQEDLEDMFRKDLDDEVEDILSDVYHCVPAYLLYDSDDDKVSALYPGERVYKVCFKDGSIYPDLHWDYENQRWADQYGNPIDI